MSGQVCSCARARWYGAIALLVATLVVGPESVWAASGAPLSALDARPANAACLAGNAAPVNGALRLAPAFPELSTRRPFDMRVSPADPARFYYVTRTGYVYTFLKGQSQAPVLALDINSNIGIDDNTNAYSPGGSEHYGIASFAFHPDFASNGWVFLVFNGRQPGDASTTSYVARYTLKPDGLTFERSSQLIIIKQVQGTGWLHHFGHLAFGPDGYLYIASGDGTLNGATYFNNIPAQRLDDLRGKLLRLDVGQSSPAEPYRIPQDNPWAGVAGARPELYAIGLRNPWRFSFDTFSGKLWLGDVGDAQSEEVNVIERGGNYGWPVFEGNTCRIPDRCPLTNAVAPVHVVRHNGESIAVIGGTVYRGQTIPYLSGKYLFRVYGRNELYAISYTDSQYSVELLLENTPNINTFFTDADNELYGTDVNGKVYQFQPGTPTGGGAPQFPQLLSQTGCVRATNPKVVSTGMIPYAVNAQLWSDGAVKKRWAALPDGQAITIEPDGDFTFPAGSVLMKMFLFQGKPFETRLLKHHNDGTWSGTTYKWNGAGTDATLVPQEGEDIQVQTGPGTSVNWRLPSRSECLLCHTQAAGFALGPDISQLNGMYVYPSNGKRGHQLATWDHIGLLANGLPAPLYNLPALSASYAPGVSNVRRARSYLQANCAHCHRPGVDIRSTMDLRYATDVASMDICNVDPHISDLGIPGAKLLAPRNPAASIIPARMKVRGDNQMPPLGTTIDDGVYRVIEGWIARADVCSTLSDSDGDGVQINADNCSTVANASQWDSDTDKFGDRCDGDFNNDLVTNDTDRQMILSAQGTSYGDPGYRAGNDFNLDGRIDAADVQYFNTSLFGRSPGPSGLRTIP